MILFHTIFLIELLNTSTSLVSFLLTCVEWMAFRTDLNVDLFLGRTCYESISAVAGNSCLMVFWMDSFSHFIHLFLILLSSQIYSDDFVFQADKISSTLHSFLIVSHNFENCKPYTIFCFFKI